MREVGQTLTGQKPINYYLSHYQNLKTELSFKKSVAELSGLRVFCNPGMEISGDYLTDREIADVLTYVRSAWGNAGSRVTARKVSAIRAKIRVVTPR
jgi:hypothetical protein